MELKELISILRQEASLYAFVITVALIAALVWHAMQPEQYQAELLLNVGRTAGAPAAEFDFDDFYRLQADERFGDTLVRWLGSPRVAEDIFAAAGVPRPGSLGGYFTGRRLSSQVVEVTFRTRQEPSVKPLAEAAVSVLNRYTGELNPDRAEDKWFRVIGSEPVISDARVPQGLAALAGLALGIFFGFWVVLAKHYFKE